MDMLMPTLTQPTVLASSLVCFTYFMDTPMPILTKATEKAWPSGTVGVDLENVLRQAKP